MIQLQNVTKIYKGKRRKKTVALRGVTFNLPEKGMVFVVGKSGCGKSTLLNLIGGGDRLTSGDITVDGNPMSKFSPADFDKYRNTTIGFIYQDFCLLDGLSVRKNVALSLELQGREDDARVKDSLTLVGLGEKIDNASTELSGGERQRVAIARVLAKDAKYVLADEPTGNLDFNSSRTVLHLLKELSKTRLVLIVSHNRADADEFADRILELSDGQIVSDVSRDPHARELTVLPDKVVFQRGHDFTEGELVTVSRALNRGGKLVQADTRFRPTVQPEADTERAVLVRKKLSFRGFRAIFSLFFKKRWVSALIAIVSIFFMVVVLGVSQFFTRFDASREIRDIMAENSSVISLQKTDGEDASVITNSRFVRVTEDDMQKFRENGANVYPIYGVSMQTATSAGASSTMQSYLRPDDRDNYKFFYAKSGLGVMQTTEEYLASLYGKDGKLTVLSGQLGEDGVGVIVTDYFADSILEANPKMRVSDEEIESGVDKYKNVTTGQMLFSRYRVRAVIETGYTERYADLIERFQRGESIDTKDKALVDLYEELDGSLNLGYSFNPDFGEEFVKDTSLGFAYFGKCRYTAGDREYTSSAQYVYQDKKNLKTGEILVREDLYRTIMGITTTVDWEEAKGTKITLRVSDYTAEQPNFEKTFTVVGKVTGGNNNALTVSPEDYKLFLQYSVYAYAVTIDGGDVMSSFTMGEEMGFKLLSPTGNALYTVARATGVFIKLFKLIIYMMLALTIVTLLSFSVGSIKKCMYEIGVLRAQGARTRHLVAAFALQQLLVGMVAAGLSTLGLFFGSGACNVILGAGFAAFSKNAFMREVQFIRFMPNVALLDVGLLLFFSVVTIIVPLLILRRVKPREIIRAKE